MRALFVIYLFFSKQGVSNGSQATADTSGSTSPAAAASSKVPADRASWGNDIEFLMSCIAMSVGLGNIWRFPFIALENGGGAFLIPYLIVLLIIGRPLYYMEMILGQFSSRSSIKVYDLVPALRGLCEIEYFCFWGFVAEAVESIHHHFVVRWKVEQTGIRIN